ncbi:hypothetical protein TNCV_3714581 [Trichonephila clavipes]|nr:hypothetical protein TNCV_3714581 [Trichonephila clavipes]
MYIQDRFGSYRSIEWTKTDWNCTRYSIITCFAQTSDSLARLTQTLARMPDVKADLLILLQLTLLIKMAFHRLIPINLRSFSTSSNHRIGGRHLRLVPSIFGKVTLLVGKSSAYPPNT